jgi:hypothetical protein
MESSRIQGRQDAGIKLAGASLDRIKRVFKSDRLRLFDATIAATRRLDWIGKAAAASRSVPRSRSETAARKSPGARDVRRRIEQGQPQSNFAGHGWLESAIAALSRLTRAFRPRSEESRSAQRPPDHFQSLDTLSRSGHVTPAAAFQSAGDSPSEYPRASLNAPRKRSIEHIVFERNASRAGGALWISSRFSRSASLAHRARAGHPSIGLVRSAHPMAANATRTIRRIGAPHSLGRADTFDLSRDRIQRALGATLSARIANAADVKNDPAFSAIRSDAVAADGFASAGANGARTLAADLVRKSPVGAIARSLRTAAGSRAAGKQTESATPSRTAISAAPGVVVNFSPTFEFAGAADQKRIEQIVADALASRIPEVLRRLHDEFANRRRVAFT